MVLIRLGDKMTSILPCTLFFVEIVALLGQMVTAAVFLRVIHDAPPDKRAKMMVFLATRN